MRFGKRRWLLRAALRSALVLCNRSRRLRPAAKEALAVFAPPGAPAIETVPVAEAAHATGPQAATTLTSSLFVSSCARGCLRRRARAGLVGTSGDAPPPPGAGDGVGSEIRRVHDRRPRGDVERDARAIVLRERIGDRRVHRDSIGRPFARSRRRP